MSDHRKLRAFHLANDLAIAIYRLTRNFPKEEQYGLTSQMRRAAVSVAANIVEGEARSSARDLMRFLNIAFGSARELGYFLELSIRLGFLSRAQAEPVIAAHLETSQVPNGLISALNKRLGNP